MPKQKVTVHNYNQPINPRIGKYHYSMFLSSYGSPIYLLQYKFEFIWMIIYWIYVVFTVAFDPYPAMNKVVDFISIDKRVPYAIYWAPTYIYLGLTTFAISAFLSHIRFFVYIFGIIVFLWHLAYFIVFWTAQSVQLPSNIGKMQASVAYYWTELIINLIMIILQCGNSQATMHYPSFLEQYVQKVNEDIVAFLAVEDVEDIHPTPIQALPQALQSPQ